MPTPFGWNPADFWVTSLTLGGMVLVLVIGVPISMRTWHRRDTSERERVAAILRDLATTLGGQFIGSRQVTRIDDEGDELGPVPDYGTAAVVSSGLAVEAGVEVMGARFGKSLRLWVPVPPGRAWAVDRLEARAVQWAGRDPSRFHRSYRCANPERLSRDARAALLDLLRHATHVELDAGGLTVWALPPRWTQRATARVHRITDAAQLTPYVKRTAAAASLLLRD